MTDTPKLAYLAVVVTVVVWAAAFAGIRAGLEGYDPGGLTLLRFLVASAVLWIYAVVAKMRWPTRADAPVIAVAGFVGMFVYHSSLNFGSVTVSAGAASLIISSVPVFTAVLAYLFLDERLPLVGWLGLGISVGGVLLIAVSQGQSFGLTWTAGLVLIAAIAQAIFLVYQKPHLTRFSALEFTSYSTWAGTGYALVYTPPLVRDLPTASLESTLAIVFLGIFPTAIGYVTYTYALARIPATRTASFLYFIPGLAITIAWLWLGEVPGSFTLVGGVLSIGGVFLVNRGRQRARKS